MFGSFSRSVTSASASVRRSSTDGRWLSQRIVSLAIGADSVPVGYPRRLAGNRDDVAGGP